MDQLSKSNIPVRVRKMNGKLEAPEKIRSISGNSIFGEDSISDWDINPEDIEIVRNAIASKRPIPGINPEELKCLEEYFNVTNDIVTTIETVVQETFDNNNYHTNSVSTDPKSFDSIKIIEHDVDRDDINDITKSVDVMDDVRDEVVQNLSFIPLNQLNVVQQDMELQNEEDIAEKLKTSISEHLNKNKRKQKIHLSDTIDKNNEAEPEVVEELEMNIKRKDFKNLKNLESSKTTKKCNPIVKEGVSIMSKRNFFILTVFIVILSMALFMLMVPSIDEACPMNDIKLIE